MSARPATPLRLVVAGYVDQVVRKEQFLARHPGAVIMTGPEAPPHRHWRGQVPGSGEVTSHDLEQLLDKLDDLVAARDARTRRPRWTFSRNHVGWQGKQKDGPELVVGRTLQHVEARVASDLIFYGKTAQSP